MILSLAISVFRAKPLLSEIMDILTFKERMRFWKIIQTREHTFAKEGTWAHAFCRLGLHCGLVLSIIFLLYTITTQNASTNIRFVGLTISFWCFCSFINYNSYIPFNKITVRILSLKPISKSNLKILLRLHDSMIDGVRNSNRIAMGVIILYLLFFIANRHHINIDSFVKVHLPILSFLIILAGHFVQIKVVTLPFLRLHSRDDFSMTTGSNLLSVYSMRFLVDLLSPFTFLIAVCLLLSFLSQHFISYSDDFNWLKRPWIFLFGFYIVLSSIHAMLSVCAPIFILMPIHHRKYSLLVLFICFIVCLVVGGYSANFFIPFLFSVLLNVYDFLSNITIFKISLIIIQAVLSGLTSVVTFWLLNMSGIQLLFYADVYTGLIMAILLNHLISYFSPQRSLITE